MDPRGMQFAMEQMGRMTPEQMQQLMSQMGNITPEMMQQAQAQMRNMQPEDWDRAKQQMSGMSPDEMARQASQATSHLAAQHQYSVNASKQLKAEGNTLHSAGQYSAAADKYRRAKENLEGLSSAEAQELRKACTLNLGSCYLNLKMYDKCAEECDAILGGDPSNLKALYRRGQAYAGLVRLRSAQADLEQAVQLASNDPKQLPLIKAKLQEVEQLLRERQPAASAMVVEEPDEEPEAVQASSSRDAAEPQPEGRPSYLREDLRPPTHPAKQAAASSTAVPITSTATSSSSMPAPASASAPAAGVPGLDPQMVRQAAEMMRNNPEMAAQMKEQMRNMTPEQLQQMGQQMGVSMSAEQARATLSTNLDFEQIAMMAEAAAPAPASSSSMHPTADPDAVAKAAKAVQENPAMLKEAAKMMSSMSPEQLQQMMGNLPGGMKMTPEMAKMAAEQVARMDEEEMKRMASMAAQMQGGAAAAAAAAAAAGPSSTAGLMPDMSQAGDILSSMPPEALSSMAQAAGAPAGMQITPDMAKMAADMFKNMKPEDMQRMAEMAANMGMAPGALGGGGSAAGAQPGMAGMAGMMDRMDPAMIDSMFGMLQGMDEEALSSMMLSSGMCESREQAASMAGQMKSMTPQQMEMMRKAAKVVQGGAKVVKKTRDFLASHLALVLAVIILIVAVLLRWWGIM